MRWTLFPPYHPLKNLQKHRDPLSLIKKQQPLILDEKQGGRGSERSDFSERALRSITEHACLSHMLSFGFLHWCGPLQSSWSYISIFVPLQMVQLSSLSSSLLTCIAQADVLFILEWIKQNSSSHAKICIGFLRDSLFNFNLVCEKF